MQPQAIVCYIYLNNIHYIIIPQALIITMIGISFGEVEYNYDDLILLKVFPSWCYAVNYCHKALHLGCCSSLRSASEHAPLKYRDLKYL